MSKKEKKADSRSLSLGELKAKTLELEDQLFKLRIQKVTGQLSNTSQLKILRKELARVKTFMTLKTTGESKKTSKAVSA